MEITYEPQEINLRMNLEDALKTYSREIQIITLKDGTNIEIISNNNQFRARPKTKQKEVGYSDNQLQLKEENDNEFDEENFEDNYNQYYYQQITPNKEILLRGKGQNKGLGKSLRKTVLKSIDGKEEEKKFENGKLRNKKSNKKNQNLNTIIQFTENNDFLQCANCHKFFCSEEKEQSTQATEKKTENNQTPQKTPQKPQQMPQQFPQQKMPYPQQFQPYPTQSPLPKQSPQQFVQNPQQKIIPSNQKKHPSPNMNPNMNMNMGFPQKNNMPQGVFPPQMRKGPQNAPNQQQFYQQKNMYAPGFNPQMGYQFRGNNQVFRARKRDVNEFELEEDYYDDNINYNNYTTEENYYYPSSAKKFNSGKIYEEYPTSNQNSHKKANKGLTRNFSYGYGYKKDMSHNREFSYADNNQVEYINMNDNEYYEYPKVKKRNMIPTGRIKKVNNHRVVNVEIPRNEPYQDQEYENYEEYYDYDN